MKSILITGGSGFIGTNLIDLLLSKGYNNIVNLDKGSPVKKSHSDYWVNENIMNLEGMTKIFEKCQPEVVIHLAARTDTLSNNLYDYEENTIGTENVLNAIKKTPSVKHSIITSTQYVYKSTEKPFQLKDDDYIPHTTYGQSKVLTEQYTRSANLNCAWTIVRPANVWGPWHMRYPMELWRIIDKGLYFHPGSGKVIRTYGYVKNIVYQILQIMEADPLRINQKTYTLGDLPIDSYQWLNELSIQLTGKRVKRLPILIFKSLSLTGDVLRRFRFPFPLYSERFHNMIEDYYAPTNITISEFGVSHPDLKDNVKESIEWVKGEGAVYFDYWKNR
ncbi:NAD-dependent epimerase/dehydratase family protein [Pedobacter immunditicola]|uniref:NAD-dependent epimerase/dehydratase family protein n=1 Tax=Pedobacter immunditicola TaxID=3133440 RepID=UPI00309DEACF